MVGRAEVVSCVFFLLSFLSYHRLLMSGAARPVARWLAMAASLFFAICSMLSKEQGITALGICGAYDILHHWTDIRGALAIVHSGNDKEKQSNGRHHSKNSHSHFNTKAQALPDMIRRLCKCMFVTVLS